MGIGKSHFLFFIIDFTFPDGFHFYPHLLAFYFGLPSDMMKPLFYTNANDLNPLTLSFLDQNQKCFRFPLHMILTIPEKTAEMFLFVKMDKTQ